MVQVVMEQQQILQVHQLLEQVVEELVQDHVVHKHLEVQVVEVEVQIINQHLGVQMKMESLELQTQEEVVVVQEI